jgi:hypothetical protein
MHAVLLSQSTSHRGLARAGAATDPYDMLQLRSKSSGHHGPSISNGLTLSARLPPRETSDSAADRTVIFA